MEMMMIMRMVVMMTTYELLLRRPNEDNTKAVGENVFLMDLPGEIPVFAFYYPAELPNVELERLLRELGERTGNNLFVNIGRLDDPQLNMIMRTFEISTLPTVVLTALSHLAATSAEDGVVSAYIRLDGKVLADPQRACSLIEELYLLYLRGEVAEAAKKARWRYRTELLRSIAQPIGAALKRLGSFIAERDISISLLEGSFELKKSA